ncbi:uncharacterized protein PpBr36_11013 [Pyricularia pennisetigena]|uniref:uncharacterized protein n=1 Tax=Pyricularia pennisetigena TaxID=1578925 RepID=UPI0011547720|nr:uncharacterized protein PpBr36_11013 [Pyricularia pennisetigena]TLS20675.1 hypothetical protein PpBr36_11013 [Pyricularia pennisetigena]
MTCYMHICTFPLSGWPNPENAISSDYNSWNPLLPDPISCFNLCDHHSCSQNKALEMSSEILQPLNPVVRPRLDPQYKKLHDTVLQYNEPTHLKAWNPSTRQPSSTSVQTGLQPVEVLEEKVKLDDFNILVLTPQDGKPEDGWPFFVWFHGGGFVYGNHSSELDLITRICKEAGCVVFSVDYRRAPEIPFPASNDDAITAVKWIFSDAVKRFSLQYDRWSIGGVSAGALLSVATLISLKAESEITKPLQQILIVPVVDNTATPDSEAWKVKPHAIMPSPERMLWYRNLWLGKTNPDWSICLLRSLQSRRRTYSQPRELPLPSSSKMPTWRWKS